MQASVLSWTAVGIPLEQFVEVGNITESDFSGYFYDTLGRTSKEERGRLVREAFGTDRLNEGECFGIPYSILVPKGWQNLWVAGRCNSSDVKVHGSIRVMPACAMMGQAAGTAAVQSIRTGQPACELDTEALVETLRSQGAYLPQTSLSRTMTRS